MASVFLDEVRITGVRTDVDETIRVLVAASAIIPVFGFHDWNYQRLGEVLIYPASFDRDYRTRGQPDENTLGMVGLEHLSGIMILSKPALLEGFDNPTGADHVGIHEFAHLVENQEGSSGLPAEVPWPVVKEWLQYVGQELRQPSAERGYINEYAYTNEHEFFAVLAEYFFKSPDTIKHKDPKLYELLRACTTRIRPRCWARPHAMAAVTATTPPAPAAAAANSSTAAGTRGSASDSPRNRTPMTATTARSRAAMGLTTATGPKARPFWKARSSGIRVRNKNSLQATASSPAAGNCGKSPGWARCWRPFTRG